MLDLLQPDAAPTLCVGEHPIVDDKVWAPNAERAILAANTGSCLAEAESCRADRAPMLDGVVEVVVELIQILLGNRCDDDRVIREKRRVLKVVKACEGVGFGRP